MRKIIHCDADCFFAAIEMRDDPSLRGRPMAVGGGVQQRGVISTCNYEARRYGVRSAMASVVAKRLCPQLIIVPHRMEKYREASLALRRIFYDYTDKVEPLSVDEAFMDVSASSACCGSATLMAQEIRQRVFAETQLTVSAGVAPNKFLAKVASDWRKPDGLYVVTPSAVAHFVKQLPVTKIMGVGKVTAEQMRRMGVVTCGDLQQFTLMQLVQRFGAFGPRLYDLSRGCDNREVETEWRRKSLSVEHTYSEDLSTDEQCLRQLPQLFIGLKSRMRRLDQDYRVIKTFIKIKFNDFSLTTLERSGAPTSLETYNELCREAYQRGNRPVRLLGMGVRLLDLQARDNFRQLELFDNAVGW